MIILTQELFNERFENLNNLNSDNAILKINNTTNTPAIIDFNAEWCAPCKALHPILQSVSMEHVSEIDIYTVNVDIEKEISIAFGIRSIPTLYFINSTGEISVKTGMMSKDSLKKLIKEKFNID